MKEQNDFTCPTNFWREQEVLTNFMSVVTPKGDELAVETKDDKQMGIMVFRVGVGGTNPSQCLWLTGRLIIILSPKNR